MERTVVDMTLKKIFDLGLVNDDSDSDCLCQRQGKKSPRRNFGVAVSYRRFRDHQRLGRGRLFRNTWVRRF